MFRIIGALGVLALAGCSGGDLTVDACAEITKGFIKSPSTFQLAKTTRNGSEVMLEFDAANSFGTPVRNWSVCKFSNPETVAGIRLSEFSFNGEKSDEMMLLARARLMADMASKR